MKILVLGAGGTGGYFGGLLARSGKQVVFVARGDHLMTIRKSGLLVKNVLGDFKIYPAKVTDNPEEVETPDLVLCCVKNYDLEKILVEFKNRFGPNTTVITTENGIDHFEIAGKILGKERVLPGGIYVFSKIESPGVILQSGGLRKIIFGEIDNSKSARVRKISEAFSKAKINFEVPTDILVPIWEKFIFICGLGGLTAYNKSSIGEILENKKLARLLEGVVNEGISIAKKINVRLLPNTFQKLMDLLHKSDPNSKSSLLFDIERGKQNELEYLNGKLVKLGNKLGIPTPANLEIYRKVKNYE